MAFNMVSPWELVVVTEAEDRLGVGSGFRHWVKTLFARDGFRQSLLVASGHGFGLIIVFVRNLIVARLLGPQEFGVAATLAMLITSVELASDMSWDKMIVQSDKGFRRSFVNTAHLLAVLRAGLMAIALFLLAHPLALAFDVPDAAIAYQLLAVAVLIKGFGHLDMKRYHRRAHYAPEVWVSLSSRFVSLVVAIICAYWWQDYRAMLVAIFSQAIIYVLMTHIVAHRPYGYRWNRSVLIEMLIFGWPLLINGWLILAASEGGKFIVGMTLSMVELSIFSVAVAVLGAPVGVLNKVILDLWLPRLSRARQRQSGRDEKGKWDGFEVLHATLGRITVGTGLVVGIAATLLGTHVVAWLYGDEFAGPGALIGWLSVAYGSRLIRTWPNVTAIALGQTADVMYANITRLLGLILAMASLQVGVSMIYIAASLAIGEVIATLFCLFLATRNLARSFWSDWGSYLIFIIAMAACGLAMPFLVGSGLVIIIMSLLAVLSFAMALLVLPVFRLGSRSSL